MFCSWLYRLKPSVGHENFREYNSNSFISNKNSLLLPNQLRWDPFELPELDQEINFIDGMATVASAGSPEMRNGLNILIYSFNHQMEKKAFYNSDGDFLIGTILTIKIIFIYFYLI